MPAAVLQAARACVLGSSNLQLGQVSAVLLLVLRPALLAGGIYMPPHACRDTMHHTGGYDTGSSRQHDCVC
jgi:hypothetical protein